MFAKPVLLAYHCCRVNCLRSMIAEVRFANAIIKPMYPSITYFPALAEIDRRYIRLSHIYLAVNFLTHNK